MNSHDGLVELVYRRSEVLAATLEEPLAKPEIVDRTDNARSTVDRAVADLAEHDLVERVGSAYRTTSAGRHLYRRLEAFAADAAAVHDARDVLAGLEDVEYVPPVAFRGAEVLTRDPSMPETVINRAMEIVRDSEHFRLCSRVQLDIYHAVTTDLLLDDELTVESIYDEGRWAVVRDEYPEQFQSIVQSGNLRAYRAESPPSYTLAVAETPAGSTMLLGTHGDCGVRGGLINDAPAAVEWAEQRLDDLRADAEPLVAGANVPGPDVVDRGRTGGTAHEASADVVADAPSDAGEDATDAAAGGETAGAGENEADAAAGGETAGAGEDVTDATSVDGAGDATSAE